MSSSALMLPAAGSHYGPRYLGIAVPISQEYKFLSTTAAASDPRPDSTLYRFSPYNHPDAQAIYSQHVLAVWKSLKVVITSGPGSYARRITLHWAWASTGLGSVRTLSDMSALPSYESHTFGGSQDPTPFERTVPATFNSGMTDVLHPLPIMGGRADFWMAVTAADIGTPVAGTWVQLTFQGTFDVYGSYFL